MISLTRLTGAPFALNPDLVERVDCTPDTVITLVDGTKYLVGESLDDVVDSVLGFRAQIIALAGAFERGHLRGRRRSRARRLRSPHPTSVPRAPRTTGPRPDHAPTFEPRTV